MILICLLCIIIAFILIRFSFELWKIAFGLLLFVVLLATCCLAVEAHEYSPIDCVNIAKVAYHEANNQSNLGKRLVIDTILNRVEHQSFPNTVNEVLNQPGQYCNPSIYPPDYYYKLVAEEIYTRTNPQVLWYRTKKYHKYGTPLLVEGSHYFSGGI